MQEASSSWILPVLPANKCQCEALMSCHFFLAAGAVDRELADAIRTVSVCFHGPGQDADNQRHSQVLRSELHNAAHRSPTVHPTGTA
jgi:hypothetical protein